MSRRHVAGVLVVLALSGCGSEPAPPAASGPAAAAPPGVGSSFWSAAVEAGAASLESEKFSTMDDMAGAANVVVLGRPIRTYPTRKVGEFEPEAPDSQIKLYGAEVKVTEVLEGSLAPDARGASSGMVVIESTTPFPPADPSVPALLFLRHKTSGPYELTGPVPAGESLYYRLVESQGVFVDDLRGRAGSPSRGSSHEGPAPVVEEVQRAGLTLAALAERLRRG